MTSYLSPNVSSLTWQPLVDMRYLFKEGVRNIHLACAPNSIQQTANQHLRQGETYVAPLSLTQRIAHFTVGALLCFPILNTINVSSILKFGF
jgi:hypothetical protein